MDNLLIYLKNSYNFFRFTILDSQNNIIDTDVELIGISQGKMAFHGQPLPNDICLVRDGNIEFDGNLTKNTIVFQIFLFKFTLLFIIHSSQIRLCFSADTF